jgi:hypothetical protein
LWSFLWGLAESPDFLGVPSEFYWLQSCLLCVVCGVCAPMFLAEAAVLIGRMDQPLADLLWNPGVDWLHLPFWLSPFCLVISRGLIVNLGVSFNVLKS